MRAVILLVAQLLIATLLIATLLIVVVIGDPCTFEPTINKNRAVVKASEMRACFDAIPFNETTRNFTVDALLDMLQLYTFTDIARNSGSPYNIHVDIPSELENIRSQKYQNDIQFHLNISALFHRLHDAHTIYFAPASYQQCAVIFPFILESFISDSDGTQQLRPLKETIPGYYSEWSKISLDQYIGKTLYKIDGVDAMQYLTAWSDHLFISKDPSVRFNQAIKQDFPIRILADTPLPEHDEVVLDFGPAGTMQFPWFVLLLKVFSSTSDFRSEISVSSPPGSVGGPGNKDTRPFHTREPVIATRDDQNVRKFLKALDELQSKADARPTKSSPAQPVQENPFNPAISLPFEPTRKMVQEVKKLGQRASSRATQPAISASRHLSPEAIQRMASAPSVDAPSTMGLQLIAVTDSHDAFYYVYNDNIAILKFTTFLPTLYPLGIPSVGDSSKLFQLITAHAKEHNITRLMIDVIGNGGGFVCLAYGLMSFLVPEWSDSTTRTQTYGLYDIRHSQLYDELVAIEFFEPASQANPATQKPYSDDSWYNPGQNVTRGGATSVYSPLWWMNCDAQQNGDLWIKNTEQHYFDDIAIITDGTCGSACSLFASQMQHKKKAKVVSVGGLTPNMETSSFAGGAVLSYPAFVDYVAGTSAPSKPKPLPTTAMSSFNYIEMYMDDNQDVPREFRRLTADYHLYFWDFSNLAHIYPKIAPVFDGVDISTITRANGTNDCPSNCNGHGYCVHTKCYCYGRFTGEECAGSYPFEPNWELYQDEEIPFPAFDFTPLIIALLVFVLVPLTCCCCACLLLCVSIAVISVVLFMSTRKRTTPVKAVVQSDSVYSPLQEVSLPHNLTGNTDNDIL